MQREWRCRWSQQSPWRRGPCARRLGGPVAGWAFLPVVVFGPSPTWTSVPYQEGTFMLFLFVAWRCPPGTRSGRKAQGRDWMGRPGLGGLALVRYEGWLSPCSTSCGDGTTCCARHMGHGHMACHQGLGVDGYAASPIHYADWEGIDSRPGPCSAHRQQSSPTGREDGAVVTASGSGCGDPLRQRVAGAGFFLLVFAGRS